MTSSISRRPTMPSRRSRNWRRNATTYCFSTSICRSCRALNLFGFDCDSSVLRARQLLQVRQGFDQFCGSLAHCSARGSVQGSVAVRCLRSSAGPYFAQQRHKVADKLRELSSVEFAGQVRQSGSHPPWKRPSLRVEVLFGIAIAAFGGV
jgi:hypothetical protein